MTDTLRLSKCEWKECTLGDICSKVLTGGTPLTSIPEYYSNGTIPWLKTKEVNFCRINKTESYISEKGLANSAAKFIPENSVIVAMYGQGDTAGRVAINKIPLATNQACCNLVIDKEIADFRFVFYYLWNSYDELVARKTGSAQPNLNTTLLKSFNLSLPPLPEQRAIASVLSSLDDKIDLLNRQNKTLEAMAETLFRQWFVEEAEEEWEQAKLGDYVSTVDNRGKTPPNSEEITPYPVIEVNALGKNNRLVDYSVIKKYVNENTYKTWFRNSLTKYDTLIATVGSIGAISMYTLEIGNIAQNIIGLHAKNISPFYIYQVIKYKLNELMQMDIGGVQPSIKVPHLLSLTIPISSNDLQSKYDSQLLQFTMKMECNYKQIRSLEKLRETLLPKLMSGEVRVQN